MLMLLLLKLLLLLLLHASQLLPHHVHFTLHALLLGACTILHFAQLTFCCTSCFLHGIDFRHAVAGAHDLRCVSVAGVHGAKRPWHGCRPHGCHGLW